MIIPGCLIEVQYLDIQVISTGPANTVSHRLVQYSNMPHFEEIDIL